MGARGSGGRRPGTTQTRDAILGAALAIFSDHGYSGTTVRGVARAAEVDPALVMHFFGNKDGLFRAALRSKYAPLRGLVEESGEDLEGLGERLLERYLAVWEDPGTAGPMHCVLDAAATSPAAADLVRGFITGEVQRAFAGHLEDQAEVRAAFVGTQLVGIALLRYVLCIEPLAALPKEQVVAVCGPTIQRYLTGELPPADAEPAEHDPAAPAGGGP